MLSPNGVGAESARGADGPAGQLFEKWIDVGGGEPAASNEAKRIGWKPISRRRTNPFRADNARFPNEANGFGTRCKW
jgi:hypothetical protein